MIDFLSIIAADVQIDSIMPKLALALFGIIVIATFLKKLNQPYIVAYLLSGVVLGPHIFNVFDDQAFIARLGNFGVVLLLFFVGMEIDPYQLIRSWKSIIISTLIQIGLSIGFVWIAGAYLGWSVAKIVLISFVITLSSTAVVVKLLQDWGEMDTTVGQCILGVLLVQDLAVVPMLITLNLLSGDSIQTNILLLQIFGALIIGLVMVLIFRKQTFKLPFDSSLSESKEIQVFAALLLCLGMALITGYLQLSTALGAFIGGMLVSKAKQTQWVHHSLESFKVVFVALFFLSVGMLVDLKYVTEKWLLVLSLTGLAFILNTFINMLALKGTGISRKESFYGGAVLSQVGEFSFVIAAVGLNLKIITGDGYQLSITVISLSLIISPLWISIVKKLTGHKTG